MWFVLESLQCSYSCWARGQQVDDDMVIQIFSHLLLSFMNCMGCSRGVLKNVRAPIAYNISNSAHKYLGINYGADSATLKTNIRSSVLLRILQNDQWRRNFSMYKGRNLFGDSIQLPIFYGSNSGFEQLFLHLRKSTLFLAPLHAKKSFGFGQVVRSASLDRNILSASLTDIM